MKDYSMRRKKTLFDTYYEHMPTFRRRNRVDPKVDSWLKPLSDDFFQPKLLPVYVRSLEAYNFCRFAFILINTYEYVPTDRVGKRRDIFEKLFPIFIFRSVCVAFVVDTFSLRVAINHKAFYFLEGNVIKRNVIHLRMHSEKAELAK